jgi:signal transduction histidine kinase
MANSARVRICVSDTGAGIPPEAFARVFEPFYSTRSDGTGLGLAIVKSVVELHGGTIDITSSADAGTCFTITLPRIGGSTPLAMSTALRAAEGASGGATRSARAPQIEREAA